MNCPSYVYFLAFVGVFLVLVLISSGIWSFCVWVSDTLDKIERTHSLAVETKRKCNLIDMDLLLASSACYPEKTSGREWSSLVLRNMRDSIAGLQERIDELQGQKKKRGKKR